MVVVLGLQRVSPCQRANRDECRVPLLIPIPVTQYSWIHLPSITVHVINILQNISTVSFINSRTPITKPSSINSGLGIGDVRLNISNSFKIENIHFHKWEPTAIFDGGRLIICVREPNGVNGPPYGIFLFFFGRTPIRLFRV